ncbi:MAG: hypothetical protein ACRD6X_07620 [Pyrinomonadaceae bacterium]
MATTGTGYNRVSKKRPCSICGKPDWCSTTATEAISFCARSILNSDRVSRYGWGVYYHDGSRPGFDFNFERSFNRFPRRRKPKISTALAPLSVRDTVYRKLIEISPASSNRVIVEARGGLLERGIEDFSLYGNLPRLVIERRILGETILDELAKEGVRSIEGVPGFWRDAKGRWRLWSEQNSFDDLMLIPFVGPDGLIRACQIRFMRYIPNKSERYVWLSSVKEKGGCGPGAPLHHADPCSRSTRSVLVTEGALKAAAAQRYLPDRYVVGNSGVATAHREIVETARRLPLEIAFDKDSFTNRHVARALSSLVRLRISDKVSFGYNEDVRIVTWDGRIKGLDDALLSGTPLKYLTVTEWLEYLTPECLEEASRQLSLA